MRKNVKKLLVTGKLFQSRPAPTPEEAEEAYQNALAAKAKAAHFLAQARVRFEEAEQMVEKAESLLPSVMGLVN